MNPIQDFTIKLHDEVVIDYVLDTGLVIDGRRERHECAFECEPSPVADTVRPILALNTRLYVERDGTVHLSTPLSDPAFERRRGSLIIRRKRCEIVVLGNTETFWKLLCLMDGTRTAAEIEAASEMPAVKQVLALLAAADALDISGRAIARFIHRSTKKGVLPGGGLEVAEILQMATDSDYRTYPASRKISLRHSVPSGLLEFYALSRRRRSYRNYNGAGIPLSDFEALLHTACGITGSLSWEGREVKLRAYPSSGGLYAVEIYPVVFAVDGLESALYHYCPLDHSLEEIRAGIDRECFLSAALPEEREMLAGVAAMLCLTGVFRRHERKYGEGGYRMMVAEAGHISQNLVLAATALDIHARPFGGVFDDMLNELLALGSDEQFLLSVIIGHVGN